MSITKIRSNAHKMIARMFETATDVRVFTLDNSFGADDDRTATVEQIREAYERSVAGGLVPRITYDAEERTLLDGSTKRPHYKVRYHGNHWVELYGAPSPAELKASASRAPRAAAPAAPAPTGDRVIDEYNAQRACEREAAAARRAERERLEARSAARRAAANAEREEREAREARAAAERRFAERAAKIARIAEALENAPDAKIDAVLALVS